MAKLVNRYFAKEGKNDDKAAQETTFSVVRHWGSAGHEHKEKPFNSYQHSSGHGASPHHALEKTRRKGNLPT